MINNLEERFTQKQISRLKSVGFSSIYDLVTYLPLGLNKVVPIEKFSTNLDKVKYLADVVLVNIERRPKRRFLILDFEHTHKLRCYFFSVANYTLKNLKIGTKYQVLLSYKNGFWTLEKFAVLAGEKTNKFILGKAARQEYLDAYYSKSASLNSNYFKAMFKRLERSDFVLNLKGLVPKKSQFIPQIIDLYNVHFPSSCSSYNETVNQWLSLKVFLKISLMSYLDMIKDDKLATRSNLDLDYLKHIVSKVPFELSVSQKKSIWDILQDVCE